MKTKGFTLIELLVVIAIIGILSSVVLASLTTARTRGQAASVQSQLSNMRAQMELYYSTNGNSYSTTGATAAACTVGSEAGPFAAAATNGVGALVAGTRSAGGTVACGATSTAWYVTGAIGGTTYCVDSTGVSTTSASVSSTDYACL